MYPRAELKHLAVRKLKLRRSIAERRTACISAAERAAKPLIWLDRVVALVQQAIPWLPVLTAPLAFLAARKSAKPSLLQTVMKWGPMIFDATRFTSSAVAHVDPDGRATAESRSRRGSR